MWRQIWRRRQLTARRLEQITRIPILRRKLLLMIPRISQERFSPQLRTEGLGVSSRTARTRRDFPSGLPLRPPLGQPRLHVHLHIQLAPALLQLLSPQSFLLLFERVLLLEPSPPAQIRSVVEHVVRVGIQSPVTALPGLLVVASHLHEALVQTQIVPDRILPTLLVLAIVREALHDELVYAVERDLLVRRVLDGHRDEGDVRVGRLHHFLGRIQLLVAV